MSEFHGRPVEEVKDLLMEFEWNWYVVADHLQCAVEELKEAFVNEQPKSSVLPKGPTPFGSGRINPDDVKRLQDFVQTRLRDQLPLILGDVDEEKRGELARDVLLDLGIPYTMVNAKDTYKVLEDDAITLRRWREQVAYLSVVEEALFKINVTLVNEEKEERRLEMEDESGSDKLEDEDD